MKKRRKPRKPARKPTAKDLTKRGLARERDWLKEAATDVERRAQAVQERTARLAKERYALAEARPLHETPNVIYIWLDGKMCRFTLRQMMVYVPDPPADD
jgi:hypothetical protein